MDTNYNRKNYYDAPGYLKPPSILESQSFVFWSESAQTQVFKCQGAGIVSLSPIPPDTYLYIDDNPVPLPMKSYNPLHTPIKKQVKIITPRTFNCGGAYTILKNIPLKFMVFAQDFEGHIPQYLFNTEHTAQIQATISQANALDLYSTGFPYFCTVRDAQSGQRNVLRVETWIDHGAGGTFLEESPLYYGDNIDSRNSTFHGHKMSFNASGYQTKRIYRPYEAGSVNVIFTIALETTPTFKGTAKNLIFFKDTGAISSDQTYTIDVRNYRYFYMAATQAGGGALAGTIYFYDYCEITGGVQNKGSFAIPVAGASNGVGSTTNARFAQVFIDVTGGAGTLVITVAAPLWDQPYF